MNPREKLGVGLFPGSAPGWFFSKPRCPVPPSSGSVPPTLADVKPQQWPWRKGLWGRSQRVGGHSSLESPTSVRPFVQRGLAWDWGWPWGGPAPHLGWVSPAATSGLCQVQPPRPTPQSLLVRRTFRVARKVVFHPGSISRGFVLWLFIRPPCPHCCALWTPGPPAP